jgi:hypothetical protein
LNAVASPEEIAFLQRTFDLLGPTSSVPKTKRIIEKETTELKCVSVGAKSAPSPSRKAACMSSNVSSIGVRTKSGNNLSSSFKSASAQLAANAQLALPRNVASAALSRTDSNYSITNANKAKQLAATQNGPNIQGQGTPKHLKRNSPDELGSPTEMDVDLDARSASTAGFFKGPDHSQSQSHLAAVSSNSSVSSSTHGAQAPVNRSLFSSRHTRAPPVTSRYAQTAPAPATSSADGASAPARSNPGDVVCVIKPSSSGCSSRVRSVSAAEMTAAPTSKAPERSLLLSSKKKDATLSSESATVTSTWSVESTVNSKASSTSFAQSQRNQLPKTPRQPLQSVLTSPAVLARSASKTAALNGSAGSKKIEIGKLFGLVGFPGKVDLPATSTGPVRNSTTATKQADSRSVGLAPFPLSLDQNMKDALQKEAVAKATLQAAEAAAESARLAASAAHAEAVRAARAIVREAENEQNRAGCGKTGSTASGHVVALSVPHILPLLTIDPVSNNADKGRWINTNSIIDGLSPKREAENPFKGMF